MKGLAEQVATFDVPHLIKDYSLRNRDASCHRVHEKWDEGSDVWLTLQGRLSGRDDISPFRAGLRGFWGAIYRLREERTTKTADGPWA